MKTTKLILTLCLLAFTAMHIMAQPPQLGARVGVNFATHLGDQDDKFTPGAALGFAANFSLCHNFSLQPEFNFIQRGGRFEYSNPFMGNNSVHFNQNYLELAATGRYNHDFTDRIGVYGEFGPSISFWTCGNSKYDGDRNKYEFDSDSDNRVDVGLNFGFGGTYDLPCGELLFGPRFYVGLTDIQKDYYTYESTVRNFSIGLNAAYMFDLGKKDEQ